MSSEPFVISGDAGPLVRELDRASAALRRFGSQEIPGPKVGGVQGGGSNNILGNFGTNIEKAYQDVHRRVAVAQRGLYETIAQTPAGGKANLQTRAQFDQIAKDAVTQINTAAAHAVKQGVPVDVAQMFGTQGIKGVFAALAAQMEQFKSQARGLAGPAGIQTTGLGGFGPNTVNKSEEQSLRALGRALQLAEQQASSFRAEVNRLAPGFVKLRQDSLTEAQSLARANADAVQNLRGRAAAVDQVTAAQQRQNQAVKQGAQLNKDIGQVLPVNRSLPAPGRLQVPAGAPGGGRFTDLTGYLQGALAGPPRVPPSSITGPGSQNFAQVTQQRLQAAEQLAGFLTKPSLGGINDAHDAVALMGRSSRELSSAERRLVTETNARSDNLQREARLTGARRAFDQLVPADVVQQYFGSGGAGGGIGGGGGLSGGPSGPPGGRRGLANSFFSGLTSRGFGRNTGDFFNLEGVAATAGTTAKYAALSLAIYGVIRATQQGAQEFLDYRDSLTDVATALSQTQDEFESLRGNAIFGGGLVSSDFENQLQGYSRLAGTNVGAQLDAAARGIRAFGDVVGEESQRDGPEKLKELGAATAEAVTQLAVITKTDYKDQTGNIIAIAQAYGLQADQLGRVVDAVANSRSLGGDLAQTSQGLANFATIAVESGLSLQEAANLISAIQAKTDQGGQLIATRLTRITQIANSAGGQRVLQGAGVDTSQGLLQQLAQLQTKFENGSLGEAQQKSLVSRLAGTANAREFTTALREMNSIIEASDPRFAKAGAGARLFERSLSDVTGTLRKLRGDVKNIIVELANSGVFSPLLLGLKLLEPVLKSVADSLGLINSLGHSIEIPFLGTLGGTARSVVLGGAEIAGGVALVNRFRKSRAQAGAVADGTSAEAVTTAGTVAARTATAEGAAAAAVLRRMNVERAATAIELERLQTQRLLADQAIRSLTLETYLGTTESARASAMQALNVVTAERNALLVEEAAAARLAGVAEAQYTTLVEAQNVVLGTNTASKFAPTGRPAGGLTGITNAFGGVGGTLQGGAFSRFFAPIKPTLNGVLGAVAAITAVDLVLSSLESASNRAAEATEKTTTALNALGDVSIATPEGLRSGAEGLRTAAETQRTADNGIIPAIQDRLGGPDRARLARNLDRQADDLEARADRLERAQRKAAVGESSGVFQDVTSVEGLTSGIEALDAVGASASKTIELLTEALGGMSSTAKTQGTVLPGQVPVITEELRALYQGSLRGAFVKAIRRSGRTDRQSADDIDAPFNRSIDAGDDLSNKLLRGTKAEFLNSGGGKSQNLSGKRLGRELAFEEFFADSEDSAKRLSEANKKARGVIEKFFKSADIGADGGLLSDADQDRLAHKLANAYVPEKLTGEERRNFRRGLFRKFREFLEGRLSPENLIVDQETASFAQTQVIQQADKESQQGRVGDADEVLRSRRAQGSIQRRLNALNEAPGKGPTVGPQRTELETQLERGRLEAALQAEVQAERDALNDSGRTPLELARTKLTTILEFEKTVVARGAKVDTATIQAELEARQELADAYDEEASANAEFQKSLLGAQDEVGRARADLAETLRQAAVAGQQNDPAAQTRLLAQANEQAAAIPRLLADRDTAAAVASLDPRDDLGRAQQELETTKRQLATVTVRGDDGQFTREYLELVTQLKQNAQALIEARAETINAQRDAFTNPGNSSDQAATAVVNAQTLLNTAKFGSSQYYQYLAQLNQAKLAYAEEEEASIEANILKRAGPDRLSKARVAVQVARAQLRFARRKARGDYDTSGNLTGEAPDFKELGEGIGKQFADGVEDFDYEQLGAESVSDALVNGITSVDYLSLGQAIAQDLADGMTAGALGAVETLVSQLAIYTSRVEAGVTPGGAVSADAIERRAAARVNVTSPTFGGGYSSINTREGKFVAPGALAISQQYGNLSSRYVGGVHKGVDIAAPMGSPVLSATGGKVVSAGYGGAYGNTILVRAPDGTLQRYGHLSKIGVEAGDRIRSGERIGSVGETGNATGPHLHYEVSRNGRTLDPEQYLAGKRSTGGGSGSKTGKGSSVPADVTQKEQAVADALFEERQAVLELAKAKLFAKVDPRSALSAAKARLKAAALDLKLYAKGTIEYYEALASYREAQYALAQQLADRRAARRQASVFPGDAVRQARVEIKNASDQLELAKKGTTEWYQAYAEWQNAQASLTAALVEANKTRFLLNHDFTNPLVQARADVRAAQQKLERDQRAGAPKRVIETDKLALQQAQAAQEQTAFDQRLQAVQTADRLGRISHAAYISYLHDEKTRLESIAHRTYQQQQELDQIDGLLKDAADAAQGQFNLGDIQLPTPYEVRRYIKTSAAGLQYQAGQGATDFGLGATQQMSNTTTNIQIDGADTAFVLKVLTQYLGTTAVSRTSSATRKA